jgi:hypothetical protein
MHQKFDDNGSGGNQRCHLQTSELPLNAAPKIIILLRRGVLDTTLCDKVCQ